MVISRMEGWEERESKEGKGKGKKNQTIEQTNKQTITKKNSAKEINSER
jgi:hypothetical protein